MIMKLDSPWCMVEDAFVLIDETSRAVTPMAEDGATLVPIRRILEAFGGHADWVAATNGVVCTLHGHQVELTLGSKTALVDGKEKELEVPARAVNQRTFLPVRFVAENLGLSVGYEPENRLVVLKEGALDTAPAALKAMDEVRAFTARACKSGDPVSLTNGTYTLPSGVVSANVITVDLSDLRVSVRAALPDGRLDHTQSFERLCAESGAAVVVNGNFFESYETVRDPVGPVMAGGEFLFGNSGSITSVGFTADNRVYYGRPSVFLRVKTADGGREQQWSAYNVNVFEQYGDGSVLYTPARGETVPVTCDGAALTVRGGVSRAYAPVKAGESLAIPGDGYVLYMGSGFTATHYFAEPELGRSLVLEPYLQREDTEGFALGEVGEMVSGAPRLLKDGAADPYEDPGFTEERFTTLSTPRTALGTTREGRLVLVSTPSATVGQLRELMLELGCVDALNLDGGASVGMYCRGRMVAAPGRELATTLQIFVD